MPQNDSRFQDIETKIAFQERLLEHLNVALTSQQRQLDALKQQVIKISHLIECPPEQIDRPEDERPPPHY
jgi:SlyX protein